MRPVGAGAPAASQGSIVLTACTGIDTTGTQFPTNGSPILPFPVENAANCSAAAPVLPAGEPALAVCNQPPTADPQTVSTDEDMAVTITLTGSDPNGDPLTFSIVTPPAHGTLGPFTSVTPTSVQVLYTPASGLQRSRQLRVPGERRAVIRHRDGRHRGRRRKRSAGRG